jgi:hypothetical protein
MTKILTYLRNYFAKNDEVIKTVNNRKADAQGNLDLRVVPGAQQLVTDTAQEGIGTFIVRSTGGSTPIGDGSAALMQIRGNSVHEGIVQEVITMTLTLTTRQEGQEPITAELDEETFKTAVTESGTTMLLYTSAWTEDPATYGVTVTGTPLAGDTITIVYVKGDRGVITVADPIRFRSTGYNLYDHAKGYAYVCKYDSTAMFKVAGSYTKLEFSETISGTKSDIVVSSGYFTIAKDGYVWVTGGDNSTTEIYMTWTDWVDGRTVSWAGYSETVIELAGIMAECFPNGLMKVGSIYDEINFNSTMVISRIERMAYTEENLAQVIADGRDYDADEDYIYAVRLEPVENYFTDVFDAYDSTDTYSAGDCRIHNTDLYVCLQDIDTAEVWTPAHWQLISGAYTANDHGMEIFDGTDVAATIVTLYGENLVDKLRTDVVTKSQDIVDGFTSTATDKALSANAGKALSDHLANLEKNASTGLISIKSYTSNNKYVVPCEGYVILNSRTDSSGKIQVNFETSNGKGFYQYMTVSSAWEIQSVFVKKGFKCYVDTSTTNSYIDFLPLDS